jgi:hypothetical protein
VLLAEIKLKGWNDSHAVNFAGEWRSGIECGTFVRASFEAECFKIGKVLDAMPMKSTIYKPSKHESPDAE